MRPYHLKFHPYSVRTPITRRPTRPQTWRRNATPPLNAAAPYRRRRLASPAPQSSRGVWHLADEYAHEQHAWCACCLTCLLLVFAAWCACWLVCVLFNILWALDGQIIHSVGNFLSPTQNVGTFYARRTAPPSPPLPPLHLPLIRPSPFTSCNCNCNCNSYLPPLCPERRQFEEEYRKQSFQSFLSFQSQAIHAITGTRQPPIARNEPPPRFSNIFWLEENPPPLLNPPHNRIHLRASDQRSFARRESDQSCPEHLRGEVRREAVRVRCRL